jgi:hypothetical protein
MELYAGLFDKKRTVAVLAGVGIALCALAISTLEHFTIQGIRYLGLFLTAFALYLLAVILLYKRSVPTKGPLLILIFIIALLQRAPLWGSEPIRGQPLC